MLKGSFIIGIIAILATYYSASFRQWIKDLVYLDDPTIENDIIDAWSRLIKQPMRNRKLKVSIGLNTNVDLIVPASELFQTLNLSPNIEPYDYPIVNSLNEFQNTFAFYFNKGHAAERFVSDINDFNRILSSSSSINKQWFIGGNAALMAESIAKQFKNSEVQLIGPIGPKLKSLLNSNIQLPNEILIENDEIHLIMEYSVNEQFYDLTTPTANRFIITHDIYNSKMEMLDKFFTITKNYSTDLIIFSGLHLLESQTNEFKDQKLKSLKSHLNNKDPRTVVHFELASIGDKTLMDKILENGIFSSVDSIGLNEQELLFLSYAAGGPHPNFFKELQGAPNLKKVLDIIEWIFFKYGTENDATSRLTRIHFHYLLFHIVAVTDTEKWSNTESSLLSGTKIAAKQACNYEYDDIETQTFRTKIHYKLGTKLFQLNDHEFVELNRTHPVINFKRKNVNFYLTPVLVCKNPVKTVGLGDAISSYGLLYAQF